MTQPGEAFGKASRKALAESKLFTASPAVRSKNASDSRSASSSSMILTSRRAAGFSEAIAAFLLAHSRQGKCEDRAAGWIWSRRDRTAMRLDDRARYRQAYSHAMAFGGDEWLKQLIGNLRRDSAASISDANFDHVVGGRRGCDDKFARCGGLHCVDRVAHEIEQDLLNLDLVG